MGDTYYYVRKEKILIGNSNADICIPDMEKEYLVTEKEIYVRGKKEKEVAIRKIEIGENILDTGDFRIIIYDEMIAVEGDHSKYACKLQPVSYKEVPFEGFPYYKRSPRIHVKVNPETIKIKNPPQKARRKPPPRARKTSAGRNFTVSCVPSRSCCLASFCCAA